MLWPIKLHIRCYKIALTILISMLINGCKEESISISLPAPELAVFDLQDQPLKLTDLKGKAVILDFWSLACGPCIAMMPPLEKISKKYKQKLTVVAINIDIFKNNDSKSKLKAFINKMKLTLPVVSDQLGITKERYQVIGTPSSFFIDKQGIVRSMHLGFAGEDTLEGKLKSIL